MWWPRNPSLEGELRMKILVLNCGSSSLKYQLINMETEEVMASGKYERIGEKEAFITHKVNGQKIEIQHPAKTHEEAVDFTLKQLINPEYKVIDSLDEVSAIGHRLVHGGEKIAESVVIDETKILNKPIVVTDYPTVKDQITNKIEGMIVDMSPEGIAGGITEMIQSEELRMQYVHNLEKREYGNQKEIEKYMALIDG